MSRNIRIILSDGNQRKLELFKNPYFFTRTLIFLKNLNCKIYILIEP